MSIRRFQLPQDIDLMNSLIMDGFQYPENPAWSVRADEIDSMVDRVKEIKRIWPFLSMIRILFPAFRDAMCGFIAEEDGKPVALINYMRHSKVPEWYIANVTVLPAYRRRGLARKLVEATLQELCDRKAHVAFLEVVVGNMPAFNLYKELGFEAYIASSEYDYVKDQLVPSESLPEGYHLDLLRRTDWITRFGFAKRVTPQNIARYEPVLERRFRSSIFNLLLGRIFQIIGKTQNHSYAIRAGNNDVVGLLDLNYRTVAGGVNHVEIQLDPAYSELAKFMVSYAVSLIQKASPAHRIALQFVDWQPALLAAAESLGCEKRFRAHRMGLFLDKN